MKTLRTYEDFKAIVFHKKQVAISKEAKNLIEESYNFLKEFANDKIIYGVNTGFGPMAQYRIEPEDQLQLQYNLIRSHASGCGEVFDIKTVRAAILCRLNSLSLGKSGVHIEAIELMRDLLNYRITPLIFQHGGVGASGDLVQLGHLALVLIGEGEVFYKGLRRPTAEERHLGNDGLGRGEFVLCRKTIAVDGKIQLCYQWTGADLWRPFFRRIKQRQTA